MLTDRAYRLPALGSADKPRHLNLKDVCGHTWKLLLYPKNSVLCRFGNSELDDGLSWDPDLLLRLGVETHPRFPLLFHQFPKAGQDEFAVLFDLFVGQGTECIKKHSSRPLVCLSGLGERNLKCCFSHLSSLIAEADDMETTFSVGSLVSALLSKPASTSEYAYFGPGCKLKTIAKAPRLREN